MEGSDLESLDQGKTKRKEKKNQSSRIRQVRRNRTHEAIPARTIAGMEQVNKDRKELRSARETKFWFWVDMGHSHI